MKRKGISPIIASVLLVAVSLAVAGIFSGWAPEMINTITDSTEQQADQRIECDQASLQITSASENTDTLDVAVRNNGDIDLAVTVAALDADGLPIDQAEQTEDGDQNLTSGSLATYSIDTSTGTPESAQAFTPDCGDVTASEVL